jgi:hypothetical protein
MVAGNDEKGCFSGRPGVAEEVLGHHVVILVSNYKTSCVHTGKEVKLMRL